ncbi:hypothetical protein [Cecembia lonarensis]|uniref:Uncharacterized protein n=1 Tax=Cecembia lonarensis (strain CCUG 58316 / KCTC 22772 / LW9) TaxID=1225176 RepID=K1LJ76_CECL9|nr:hypothetical protein [Cecembia lonarensis]EKB50353.1 hypothetical protein B879_01061 [Cecembia lonarensis LW9]
MDNISKKNIYNTPDGYFDGLSEQILQRHEREKVKQISVFKKYAAAAVLVLGLGIYFLNDVGQSTATETNNISQEIDRYINADYWQVEDVLMLAENPNDILDEIILAEWSEYNWEEDDFENNIWY